MNTILALFIACMNTPDGNSNYCSIVSTRFNPAAVERVYEIAAKNNEDVGFIKPFEVSACLLTGWTAEELQGEGNDLEYCAEFSEY